MSMSVLPAYTYVDHMPGTRGGKGRALDPLQMELQTVMSHHWVLGMEPWSSARPASALIH